jgi:glycosyltransferase involved in cell wall biosynthesis
MSYKIALVGNMNNNFFAITRYLRDLGYDAHLFYRVGMEHFQPIADTYTTDYTNYCHQINWLDEGFYNIDIALVKNDLTGFDFYIGQGDEAVAAYRADFNMDIYYPYGSDVYKYAYLPAEFTALQKVKIMFGLNGISYRQMKQGTAAKYMRAVIVNAAHILAEYTNEDFERKLKGLQVKGDYRYYPMPMLYYKEYEGPLLVDEAMKTKMDAVRSANDFVVLYHGRQEWKTYHNDFTGKNTHHLIVGFAEYVKANPGKKSCLVMLEYGSDTEHSKELVSELGIADSVQWFPTMYRKDLMYIISKAHVCTGEFGRSYLTFGTIIEAMLMKKPVIHFRDDKLYTHHKELYPMLCAREPHEIAQALSWAANNVDELKTMGIAAYSWARRYIIDAPMQYLESLIEKKRAYRV